MNYLFIVLMLAGIVPASNLNYNFWGIDGMGNKIDPANGGSSGGLNWNAAIPIQLNAINISFTPLPTHTLSDSDFYSGIDCGTTFAKVDPKGDKPQSVPADTVGCGQSFWNAFYARRSGLYQSSYDTAEVFVQRCPTDYYAPAAFGVMNGDMQGGGNGPFPGGSISFGQWLLSALAWNPGDPTYFCADVENLGALFATSDTGWVAGNTDLNKGLSVLFWLIHNPVCANSDDSELYVNGRGSQVETYENWPGLNRDSVPLDTTIYTMQQLGLDSVLKYTGLLGVGNNTPSIISNPTAYPNPTGEGTVISFGIAREAYVAISLYDVLGHQVSSSGFGGVVEPGNLSVPMSLVGLPAGTYFARIQTTYGEAQTVKLVKE